MLKNRRAYPEWKIQRHRQHWTNYTEHRQKKKTIQKIKKMNNTNPTQNQYLLKEYDTWAPWFCSWIKRVNIRVNKNSLEKMTNVMLCCHQKSTQGLINCFRRKMHNKIPFQKSNIIALLNCACNFIFVLRKG